MKRCASCLIAVVVLVAGACGDDAQPANGRDASAQDAQPADASAADAATGRDAAADAGRTRCVPPDGSSELPVDDLVLELPDIPPPDLPFPVGVRTASGLPLTAAAAVCAGGQPLTTLKLYRGRGSATLTLPEGKTLLEVAATRAHGERAIKVTARPARELSGSLADADLGALEVEDLQLQGDVQIPADATVTVPAGTRLLFSANATLEVAGHLELRGTEDRPILLTRASDAAWGGIRMSPGASAIIEHAWLVAAGGDAARNWGHSHSQPVMWIDRAELAMHGGGLVDNPGKAFGADQSRIELDGVLVSRCDTGGEFANSELHIQNGHVLEMPDGDGQANDDDNDGIYVSGAPYDAEDHPIESSITDSVFMTGEDDGIDHNNGQLRIERVWIEGFAHEGVAASHGNRVGLFDCVLRANGQGIEAGYGSPSVVIEHVLSTDNGVGVRFGDDYNRSVTGSIEVRNSVIRGNRTADVRNYVNQLSGPSEGAIRIACSNVSDSAWAGANGNVDEAPLPASTPDGCVRAPALNAAECGGEIPGPATFCAP